MTFSKFPLSLLFGVGLMFFGTQAYSKELLYQDQQIEFFATEDAKKQCDIVSQDLKAWMDWEELKILSKLFPDWKSKLVEKKIEVVFHPVQENEYSSFYYEEKGLVHLSCGEDIKDQWKSFFAHELVHVVLSSHNRAPVWFEEGFAQLVEIEAGGKRPIHALQALSHSKTIPDFEINAPLSSSASYGLSYLFAMYIQREFSGWSALLDISGYNKSSPCEVKKEDHGISCIAERIKRSGKTINQQELLKNFEKILFYPNQNRKWKNEKEYKKWAYPGWFGFLNELL